MIGIGGGGVFSSNVPWLRPVGGLVKQRLDTERTVRNIEFGDELASYPSTTYDELTGYGRVDPWGDTRSFYRLRPENIEKCGSGI